MLALIIIAAILFGFFLWAYSRVFHAKQTHTLAPAVPSIFATSRGRYCYGTTECARRRIQISRGILRAENGVTI